MSAKNWIKVWTEVTYRVFGRVCRLEQISVRQIHWVVKKWSGTPAADVGVWFYSFLTSLMVFEKWLNEIAFYSDIVQLSKAQSIISQATLLFYVHIITNAPLGGNISWPFFVWNTLYFWPLCQARSAVLFLFRLDSIIITHPADWQAGHVLPWGEPLISE